MASLSKAASFDIVKPSSQWRSIDCSSPNSLVRNHPFDSGVAITNFAQRGAGVLTYSRRWTDDGSRVELEARGGLGLPNPANRRLLEFHDDTPRDHLFVLNDFATAQDRCAR